MLGALTIGTSAAVTGSEPAAVMDACEPDGIPAPEVEECCASVDHPSGGDDTDHDAYSAHARLPVPARIILPATAFSAPPRNALAGAYLSQAPPLA